MLTEVRELSTGPSEQQLEEGVDWAIQQAASGRNLLVHCAHGHGRSAALLCAILLATGEASSVVDAEQILKAVRPRVRLNPRQKAAVTSWWSLRKKK
jgi:protein-tyrosine phosphatase